MPAAGCGRRGVTIYGGAFPGRVRGRPPNMNIRFLLAALAIAAVAAPAWADTNDARKIAFEPSYAVLLSLSKIGDRFAIRALQTGRSFGGEMECMSYLAEKEAAQRDEDWKRFGARETLGLVLGALCVPERLAERLDEAAGIFFRPNVSKPRQPFVAPDTAKFAGGPWRMVLYATARTASGSEIRPVERPPAADEKPGLEFATEDSCETALILRRAAIWESFLALILIAQSHPALLADQAVLGAMCTPAGLFDFVTGLVPAEIQEAAPN